MRSRKIQSAFLLSMGLLALSTSAQTPVPHKAYLGREMSVEKHLRDDDEFSLSLKELLGFGKKLFMANWTEEEGAGRPETKGTGAGLSDRSQPLVGTRAFNRVSGPDANSCYGCHNMPYGIPGGGGDFVTSVFVLAQRFDFATLDRADSLPTKGSVDEEGKPVTIQTIG